MTAFPERPEDQVRRPRLEEPAGLPPLRRERGGRRQVDEGPPPLQRRLLAHDARHRRRSVRPGHDAPALGRAERHGRERHATASAWPSSSCEKLGAPFYCFHDRDVAPEGKTLAETQQESRRGGQGAQGGAAADRHQAAVGHGQPVQQPALHARRGHQLQRRRLRLRRRPGEEGPGSDQGARRRGLRVLGRPRRLPEPLEHRHEARARPPRPRSCTWPSTTPSRSASPASSTSSPSPRSRPSTSTTSTRPPASTSCGPTAWPTTSS